LAAKKKGAKIVVRQLAATKYYSLKANRKKGGKKEYRQRRISSANRR